MIYINYILLQIFIALTFGQLSQSIVDSLPIYNPSTRCHDLTLIDEDLTFAICLQRATNKQHPYNLYTSPSFCSVNYPPNGHLVDLISLSSLTIQQIFENLINLINTKESHIDFPEPNFLWIASNFTQNLTNNSFWCSNQCENKTQLGKFLIIKLRCQYGNNSKPCLTTKHTHWDRAPFICLKNQTTKQKKQIESTPNYSNKNQTTKEIESTSNYSNENHLNKTIIFYDSTPCLIARTTTHEYTFCFRRQICPQSHTSAFCTTKFDAYNICQKEKQNSNLLTIENDEEYQLINNIINSYSNQTILNSNGLIKNKYVQRAQWMWIDGLKSLNDIYRWNISNNSLTPIKDKYWCDNLTNCSGGKGRDHIVLNIVCQTNKRISQICLASRRQTEPGPFICKRTLKSNEPPITNYTFLRDSIPIVPPDISPVYDKNLTSIYYDEHHCLTVQTHTHLYTFCLRRQNCTLRQAFCTKWSQAQKDCQLLKNQAELLTIDNENERTLITDIVNDYFNETRLTFNGSSYRYYRLADFLWIDGIQQDNNNRTYLWKNGLELIPEYLWCPKNECISIDHPRVMLNLLCKNKSSLVCLGTRIEWKPAPYVCKRVRPIDSCPILFDKIRSIQSSEMLVVTVNRTIALIKCKHPDYNTQIKVQYQCDIQSNQWNLIYENKNFTCPNYVMPPMAISINESQPAIKTPISINGSQPSRKTTTSTSTSLSYIITTIPSVIKEYDCSQSELLTLINHLPTKSHYVSSEKVLSYSSLYYDMKLTCSANNSIQVTYRCDLLTKKWIYVHGNTNHFRTCYALCNNKERNDLLNKYFTKSEQTRICINYNRKNKSLRLRCFNQNENQWKSINYQCGTLTITKDQWFSLHTCFSSPIITTTTLPTAMVSMGVTELIPSCPSSVTHDSQCEYQTGQYILDVNGCLRKICPSRSRLCDTIRCPPDRICRVVICKSCIHTDYLQAVCEYPKEPSLCEFEKQLSLLNNHESINRWVQQAIDIVQRYANEQRQRLTSSWPVLTIN